MKKTRTANLHHLYHEPLPENLKLTPKVEVDNVHQRQTTDVYEHALTITAWQQIYDQLHPGKFHGEFTEIRKRKLTAVCSHQTRIGNLDAHLI